MHNYAKKRVKIAPLNLKKEKKYLKFTLEKEKQFIHQIIQNNYYNNLMNLYSEVNKNMSAANLLNLNKPDILIDSFKDLCGI